MDQIVKDIKQRFFAFRNGILADALRRHSGYSVIFGLQVPQLAEIARDLKQDMALAERLWSETHVRESRLLASYLFPPAEVSMETAVRLAAEAANEEEADMLAFRLFKRLPFAAELLEQMERTDNVSPYMIKTLRNHLS